MYSAIDMTATFAGLSGGFLLFQHFGRKQVFPPGLSMLMLLFFLTIGILIAPLGSLGMFAADGKYYLNWGWTLGERWMSGDFSISNPSGSPAAPNSKALWPIIIGLLSTVLGKVTLVPIFINAFSATLIVVILTVVSRTVFGSVNPKAVALVTLSSPVFVFYAGSLYRESLFWLGLSLFLLGMVQTFGAKSRPGLIFLLLGAVIAISFRADFAIPLVVGSLSVAIATQQTTNGGLRERVAPLGLATLTATIGFSIWLRWFAWEPAEVSAGRKWTSRDEVDTTLSALLGRETEAPEPEPLTLTLLSEVPWGWLIVVGFGLSALLNLTLIASAIGKTEVFRARTWTGPATLFLLAIIGASVVSGNFGLFVRLAQPALLATSPYAANNLFVSKPFQRFFQR